MYTASAVAEKTHAKAAEVRYFARKYHLAKISIENKQTFIFDKKDYRLFLLYKNILKKKKDDKKQLYFSFYDEQRTAIQKQNTVSKRTLQREKVLIKKLCALLRSAGIHGIDKNILQKALKIDKKRLANLLNKNPSLPIAEDETIDNNLYWIGII